eukprot:Skav211522  [mRNA]  locus=scaffold352:249456:249743:- [translate_table: standard]
MLLCRTLHSPQWTNQSVGFVRGSRMVPFKVCRHGKYKAYETYCKPKHSARGPTLKATEGRRLRLVHRRRRNLHNGLLQLLQQGRLARSQLGQLLL